MDFPQLKAWLRLPGERQNVSIYDIKFYPYSEPGEDPIFAAVAEREIYICKPVRKSATSKTNNLEVLTVLEDPDEDSSLNSVAWSVDIDTDEPLVCVAGSGSKNIKIFNVVTGELVRILYGHGGAINDLVTSPVSPQILASCSGDYTIRIWNLDVRYRRQPCAAILSGEGHRQTILSIAFHDNGRWLLSGGQDTMICLWSLPPVPDENAGTDKPTVVVYPHFASIGMHSDYVDCVRFWGDLILSKASTGNNIKVTRGEIMLWKIDGFFSGNDNPPEPPMPGYGRSTRSAFGEGFQRLSTFDVTNVEPFYMRFGLLKEYNYRPILVMGNIKARFFFWDLQRFEERRSTGKIRTSIAQDNERIKDIIDQNRKRKNGVDQVFNKKTAAGQVLTINTRASSATGSDTSARDQSPVVKSDTGDKDSPLLVKNNKRKRDLKERVLLNNAERASSANSDLTLTRASSRISKGSGVSLIPRTSLVPGPRPAPASVPTSTPTSAPTPVPTSVPTSAPISAPTPTLVKKQSMTPDSLNKSSRHTSETADPKPELPPRSMRNYTRHAAHKTTVVNCPIDFACRAIDWSLDGKWCVGVGDHGMIAVFGRWLDK
ncbi:WD40 repeat-like protein, partial [Aureobasidium melanogenum]